MLSVYLKLQYLKKRVGECTETFPLLKTISKFIDCGQSSCCPIIIGYMSLLYLYVARLGGKLEMRRVSGEAVLFHDGQAFHTCCCRDEDDNLHKLCLAELELNLSWLVSACQCLRLTCNKHIHQMGQHPCTCGYSMYKQLKVRLFQTCLPVLFLQAACQPGHMGKIKSKHHNVWWPCSFFVCFFFFLIYFVLGYFYVWMLC